MIFFWVPVENGGTYVRTQSLCVDPWVNYYTVSPDYTREEWVRETKSEGGIIDATVLVNTCQEVTVSELTK